MLKSLESISFETVFMAFNKVFRDYEMQVNQEELWVLLNRRGYVPSLSFGIFVDEELVSFTLNGIGEFGMKKTAYDTGTGTIKEFRGKGYASRIFTESIPFLKNAGIEQYVLEVLQHNSSAISMYQKLGFSITREFNYFKQECSSLKKPFSKLSTVYQFQEIGLNKKSEMQSFFDFEPSWQNSFESIQRRESDFTLVGAYKNQELVGFCIYEPNSGDVTQLAVHKKHRRKGIATALFSEALKQNKHEFIKVINSEVSCENMTHFFNSLGITIKGKQFEMIKQLS
jgi:ribosomal protein S18 acetylase RimI-like enzyme